MRWFWIDKYIEFESGRQAKAIKNVSLAEEYLVDHFPGFPVMPNTLIIEGMAQTAGLLLAEHQQFTKSVVLAKISSARFLLDARPGDTLTYTATIKNLKSRGAIAKVTSEKNGQLQAEAEMMFAYLESGASGSPPISPDVFRHIMRVIGAYEASKPSVPVPVAAEGAFAEEGDEQSAAPRYRRLPR